MLDDDVRRHLAEWAEGRRCPNCGRLGLLIEWRPSPALVCPNEACDFEATNKP